MNQKAKAILICFCVFSSAAIAQPKMRENPFFGFDFVLYPIAIKWACGGAKEKDLAVFNALIDAAPSEAMPTDLPLTIQTMANETELDSALAKLMGTEMSKRQINALCTAALPIDVDWMTPKNFFEQDGSRMPPQQERAWAEFFQVVERLQ